MVISLSSSPTGRHRLNRLQLAVLALCLSQMGAAAAIEVVLSADVSGRRTVNGSLLSASDTATSPDGLQIGAFGALAIASAGRMEASTRASGNLSGQTADRAEVTVFARWAGAGLDPVQAGLLAQLTLSGFGALGGNAADPALAQAATAAFVRAQGVDLRSEKSCFGTELGCDERLDPLPDSIAVQAGRELEIGLTGTAFAIGGASFNNGMNSGASSFAVLSFGLDLIEDRRHWKPVLPAVMTADASWVEKAAPDATSWAVFNRTTPRSLTLGLAAGSAWRGLIVDGEDIALALAGGTLTLGDAGPSQKTYSIRVGEGRSVDSTLTLRNGRVLASNDVLVGGVFGSTGPMATLNLEEGAVLDQTAGAGLGSVLVGDKGPGALVVRDGSRIRTNVLALARSAPGSGDTGPLRSSLLVTGAGSKLTATLVSLGDRGEATATVSGGGVIQAQGLNLAQRASGRATLTVDGTSSKLVLTGGFANVGLGGRATLEALNGAAIEGGGSLLTVGSGRVSDFSVLRISGPGSSLSDAGVVVHAGGLLEVRQGAQWAGPGNILEVRGGQALFNSAKVTLAGANVAGLFDGPKLLASGQWTIENGSVVDATGADLAVDAGGRLNLNGSGSRLFGFNELRVNGVVAVNFGAVLEGDTLGLDAESSLQGTGTVKVKNKIVAAGKIKPGNSPGLLRIEGNLELTDTAELVLEMAGTAAGTEYDVLQVTGNLTLLGGHVNLAFINGFAPRQGQQFVLLDVAGSFQSSAAFGVTGLASGWQFDTAYDPGTGRLTLNSLSDGVSAVPEPASWLLWGAAGLAGWLMRRRA